MRPDPRKKSPAAAGQAASIQGVSYPGVPIRNLSLKISNQNVCTTVVQIGSASV